MNGIYNIKGKTSVNILVSNYSNKHVTFNKGEYVGHLEPTIENTDEEKNHKLKPNIEAKLEALLKQYATKFTQDETSIGTTSLKK